MFPRILDSQVYAKHTDNIFADEVWREGIGS